MSVTIPQDTKEIKETENTTSNGFVTFVRLYIHEVIEAFIAILVIRLAMEKEINLPKTIKASLAIGLLTYFVEQYNPDFKANIRQGISFTVGSQLMNGFA